MKKLAIYLFIAGIIILLFTGAYHLTNQTERIVTTASTKPTEPSIPLNADTIFELVNQERIKAGVKPLVRDARLDATAQERADDMTARKYFDHYDPVTGESLVVIKPVVTECQYASENLSQAWKPGDRSINAVEGWMLSKDHREALLDPDYDISGLAVSGTKAVQHFCSK